MIAYLHGYIKFIFNDYCILEVNGVGYKVFTDAHSLQSLKVGESAEFFIHTAVRDDAILLFGLTKKPALALTGFF
jgi:Holliday junction DNA helicase RuvA